MVPKSDSDPPVLRVGLTGGVASGKSTVAAWLAALGAAIIDADRIAHESFRMGTPVYERIVTRFGKSLLDDTGAIDRRRLGAFVFSDPSARRDIEAIVHPAVRSEIERRVARIVAERGAAIVVIDAALLVETGAWKDCDCLVVTHCARESQIHRSIARDGLSRAEAEARIDAQAPLADKLALADWALDSDLPIEENERQAGELWNALVAEHARRFAPGLLSRRLDELS